MNIFTLSGNLTKDCRTGTTPNGKSVCNFTVANTTGFNENEHTEFIDCALWGKRAEGGVVQYLKKGQKVYISGQARISQREHEGKTYANISVMVNDLDLAGGRDQQPAPQQPAQQQAPQQQNAPIDGFDEFGSAPF